MSSKTSMNKTEVKFNLRQISKQLQKASKMHKKQSEEIERLIKKIK